MAAKPTALFLLVFLLTSCGPSTGARTAGLPPIPSPDLSSIEEAVRQDIAKSRTALESQLTRADPDSLSPLYGTLGITYEKYEFVDAARACYENAEASNPADYRWPYYLGRVYFTEGRLDDSLAAFKRCLALEDYLPAQVLVGTVQLKRQQLDEARSAYEVAVAKEAQCGPAIFGLGRVAAANRNWSEAVQFYERAKSIDPGATEVNYALGIAYRHLGQLEKARNYIEKEGHFKFALRDPLGEALRADVAGWRYHQNLGNDYVRENQLGPAEAAFDKATQSAPQDEVYLPLSNRGAVRIMMADELTALGKHDRAWKKIEQARRDLDRAVEINANNPRTLANYGRVLSLFGEDERAAQIYKESIALDEQQIESHFNLGNCYRRLGQFERAVPSYLQVLEMFPADEGARVSLALTYLRLGKHAEARKILETGQSVLENSLKLDSILARLLAARPRDEVESIRALQLAHKVARAEVAAGSQIPSQQTLVTLVIANTHVGQFKEAARLIEKGLSIAGSPDGDLGELVTRLRRYQKLVRDKKKITETWPTDHPALSPPPLN